MKRSAANWWRINFLTVLAAAAWARAIGLLQGTTKLDSDIIYILIGDVRCNVYWGLGNDWSKALLVLLQFGLCQLFVYQLLRDP